MAQRIVESPSSPLIVILDIDETLLYSCYTPISGKAPDFYAEDYLVYVRPRVTSFLQRLIETPQHYILVVWTTSNKTYADAILQHLGIYKHISLILTQDDCVVGEAPWREDRAMPYLRFKDIVKIRRKFRCSRSRIIAVDDRCDVYLRSYSNLLQVPAFQGDEIDGFSFDDVFFALEYLRTQPNVRRIEKRSWWNCGPVHTNLHKNKLAEQSSEL